MAFFPSLPGTKTLGSLAAACGLGLAAGAFGQFAGTGRFELVGAVRVDEVDSQVRADLAQAEELAGLEQWDAALDRLRRAAQGAGNRLVPTPAGDRHVAMADFIALRLAAWPAEGLARARERFDPLAGPLFERALAARDEAALARIVDDYFVASVADDALLALGDIALEQGRIDSARRHWLRINPRLAAERPNAAATERTAPSPPDLASYPGSDLDPAAVAARLAVASLLEADRPRARREIDDLARRYPSAAGALGGRTGPYRALLEELWESSAAWPLPAELVDWPTFAGNVQRNALAAQAPEIGALAWTVPLGNEPSRGAPPGPLIGSRRQGEYPATPCTTFPIWLAREGRDLVFYGTDRAVFALEAATGRPAWPTGGPLGLIHERSAPPAAGRRRVFGIPRHTLSACGNLLLARLGAPGAAGRGGPRGAAPSYLVCLDLRSEGRLLWQLPAEADEAIFQRGGWSFAGPPVCDGRHAYAALRRTDIRSQSFVACYDVSSGRLKWQSFVCAADTPGQGAVEEQSLDLLTLAERRLYFNTNQGVVACLEAADGRVCWAARYPRATSGDLARPAGHFTRQPNPAVYHRGRLIVAPVDTPCVLALSADSGRLLWRTPASFDDVRYVLGAHQGQVVVSGDRLHWLSGDDGRIIRSFPEGAARLGCGRGILAHGQVYWPTRGEGDQIRVFDLATGRPLRTIDLDRGRGGAAGNLLVAGDHTLVAAHDALYCFQPRGERPSSFDTRRTAARETFGSPPDAATVAAAAAPR